MLPQIGHGVRTRTYALRKSRHARGIVARSELASSPLYLGLQRSNGLNIRTAL